jgi:hypothetical protein
VLLTLVANGRNLNQKSFQNFYWTPLGCWININTLNLPSVSTTPEVRVVKFAAGDVDTGGKFSVVDTGGQFVAGGVDTQVANLPLLSLIPYYYFQKMIHDSWKKPEAKI